MRRVLSCLLSFAIATAAVIAPALPATAAPGPAIAMSKSAPSSILAGGDIAYTLTASNKADGAVPEYNVSFRDVLPTGVSYLPGSTAPASAGEPTVYADKPGVGQTTLVWRDAFDLQPGDTNGLTFSTRPDVANKLVGNTVNNIGQVYANKAPRKVPTFDANGVIIGASASELAESNPVDTKISALSVEKSEPSPESELLRGIHTQSTVYTVKVTNNDVAPTDGVVVTDYLPANLEFLGCGGVDNTPALAPEYAGAPSLTATPLVENCRVPVSVETVADPAGYPAGVYTKVVWNLGNLAVGEIVNVKYAAGVPLRENTLFGAAPAPESLEQAANLDNNTGAPTRQDGDGASATNYVVAAGTYKGAVAAESDTDAQAAGKHTVTLHDLRIVKSIEDATTFIPGQIATYVLTLDAGEYTNSSDIIITDTLPNGMCPLGAENYTDSKVPECATQAGSEPSVDYQSVTENADGSFTVVFKPIAAIAANGSVTVEYPAMMRLNYKNGNPTSAGDSFKNTVKQSATTLPVSANNVDTGMNTVTDPSSATLDTGVETLSKEIGTRATSGECVSADYGNGEPQTAVDTTFVQGDTVCFRITVKFSTAVDTRNPQVTDFLPENLDYIDGSAKPGASNTLPTEQIELANNNGALTWVLGTTHPGDSIKTVPMDAVFQVVFGATVNKSAPAAADKAGNLAKFRATNSDGVARSLRDGADFTVVPAPIALAKKAATVNGTATTGGGKDVTVKEGDQIVFNVDVSNTSGALPSIVAQEISNPDVWDILPLPLTCADISVMSNNGACTDPTDDGHPTFEGNDKRSAIRWKATGLTIAAGNSHTFSYTVTVPAGVSVGEALVNTAAVRSYTAATNTGSGGTEYFPGQNIDTSVPVENQDPLPATDTAKIKLPTVALTKGVISSVKEAGNAGTEESPQPSTDATIGENVTYTVTATIPAGSTVFNGTLTDPLPSGLTLVTAAASFAPDSGTPVFSSTLPTGVSVTDTTIGFGTSYNNSTATDQLFRMVITARVVKTDASNLQGATKTNTATFSSDAGGAAGDGRTDPANVTAKADTKIVEPAPSLVKSNSAPATVGGGQTVTFTLKASNAAGRVPLHDVWVVDCLPAGLTFGAYGTMSQGSTAAAQKPAPGPGGNNVSCATGTTQLGWNVGDIAAASTATLVYTATVDTDAAGALSYTNNAFLTGNSLAGERLTPSSEGDTNARIYPSTASSSVKISGATTAKGVDKPQATVGETVTYTVTTTLPANVNFYNATIVDTLPAGIDVASLALGTVSCVNTDKSACDIVSAGKLTAAGSTVAFLLGDVTASAQARSVSLTYSAKIADIRPAATIGKVLKNAAHAAWDVTNKKPAPTNAGYVFDQKGPNATVDVTVVEPAVSLAKSVDNAAPEPGSPFKYTLNVSNPNATYASSAYNVIVTDKVPANVVVDASTISGGGVLTGANAVTGGGTITWTIAGPLAPGGVQSLTYSATLAPSANLTTAPLVNRAEVTSYQSLPTGGRTYTGPADTATVTPKFPALTAAKTTPNGSLAYIGKPLNWQVTVTNSIGAGTAYNAGAFDALPAGWSYVENSARVIVNGGASTAVEPVILGQKLTWSDLGTLPARANLVINYQAIPGESVTTTPGVGITVPHTNTATATGSDNTGVPSNGSGSYSGPEVEAEAQIASADLSIAKAEGVQPIAGSTGTWTLTVTNTGTDTAVGPFTVTDNSPVPAGFTLNGMSGAGWTCEPATGTCVRSNASETLATGASFPVITLSYSVASNVADGTEYSNTASVAGGTHDPNPDNDTSTSTTTVQAQADLGLVKALTTPLVAGQEASYTLTVRNHGPSDSAAGFFIEDVLPAGTTFVSAAGGTDWTCPAPVDGVLSCTYGEVLPLNESAPQIVVTIGIPSSMTADVTNSATVTVVTPEPEDAPEPNTDTVTRTPAQSADLAIEKFRTDALVAGAIGKYTIAVANYGPSDARGVVVTDTLDPNLSFDSFTGADWDCAAVEQLVTCTYINNEGVFQATEPAATSTFTLNVLVAQSLDEPVANTAAVSSTTPDPVNGNNESTSPGTPITGLADLSLAKTHSGDATAGSALDYVLTVSNDGPSTVVGDVTVTDTLPNGMTFTGFTGAGWSCTPEGQIVTCLGADGLATGDQSVVTITVMISQNAGPGTLVNSATVTAPEQTPDPDLTNNDAVAPTEVLRQSAMTLVKTLDTPVPVLAGTNATFTLTATNNGPSEATGVVVTDTLPQYLSYVSAVGDGWACTHEAQVISCERDIAVVVGPESTVPPITVVATVDSGTPVDPETGLAVLQNTAALTTESDSTVTNPPAVDVPVKAVADLAVIKSLHETVVDGKAVAGTNLIWNIDVTNNGPSNAEGPLTVNDTLPPYQTFVSATGMGWECTALDVPVDPTIGQDISCTNTGLVTGTSAPTLELTVHIDASAPANAAVVNTAVVSGPTADVVPENNTSSATVVIEREQKLAISKTHTGNGVIGGTLDFQIAVSNDSPSTATQIHVEDALPAGLRYVAAAGEGWICTSENDTILCDYEAALAPNEVAPIITVTALVETIAYPAVVNSATASSLDPDLPGVVTTEDPVNVDPAASLQISKTHEGSFTAGTSANYTLQVSNTGLTESPGPVVVTDTLPAGLSFTAAAGEGWLCSAEDQDVTCTRDGALAVGAAAPITLTVDVLPAAFPSVENTATVNGPGSEPASSTDTAEVAPDVAWSIDKKLAGYKDNKARYAITVTNTGANQTITETVVIDRLPNGLEYLSFAGEGWQCQDEVNVVTCNYAESIEAGGSRTVELTTAVTAAPGTTISNIAEVTGGGSAQASVTTDPEPETPAVVEPEPETPAVEVPGSDAVSDPADLTVTPDGQLSASGATATPLIGAAILLLLAGAGALFIRRRKSAQA